MQTRVVSASEAGIIEEAAALIRSGQLVAFPTETVYGLGANAFDLAAVAHIFEAKGRPATDPLIVHIPTIDFLSQVAVDVPDVAHLLITRFWPGPLTLVLKKQPGVVSAVSAGQPTVAVRMPAHPVALALLKAAGVPIAAPSANLFAHTSPTTAHHVLNDLNGRLPLILDGGPTQVGVESTIVDVTGDHPRLLRPGGLALDAIHELLPDVEVVTRYTQPDDGPAQAPGMLSRHYSPRAELHLFDGPDTRVREAIVASAGDLISQGKRVGFLIAEQDCAVLADFSVPLVVLGSLDHLEEVARNLYAGMRTLDDMNVEIILARSFPAEGLGLAIRDRLIRAANGRIMPV